MFTSIENYQTFVLINNMFIPVDNIAYFEYEDNKLKLYFKYGPKLFITVDEDIKDMEEASKYIDSILRPHSEKDF